MTPPSKYLPTFLSPNSSPLKRLRDASVESLMDLDDAGLSEALSFARRRLRLANLGIFLSFVGMGIGHLAIGVFDAKLETLNSALPFPPAFLAVWFCLWAFCMILSGAASSQWDDLIDRLAPLNLDSDSELAETLDLLKTSKGAQRLARRAQERGRALRAFDLEMMKEAQKSERRRRADRELQRRLGAPRL